MKNRNTGVISLFLGCAIACLCAEDEICEALTRTDAIPTGHVEHVDDSYMEGYIQALVNAHYYEFGVLVEVIDGNVYLYNLPKNALTKESIISFVYDIPGVKSVEALDEFPHKELEHIEQREVKPQISGTWFPQQTLLFPPMVANPRETVYSAVYRLGDVVLGKHSIAVSFGDYFPIFRWHNVWRWQGDFEISIQAGAWSVFKMWVNRPNESAELVNTDYMVGFPLMYAAGKWAFRWRIYHISSHLGDEYMVANPQVPRVNPSMEAIDFFVNYQLSQGVRFFWGLGTVVHSDKTYPLKPLYFEWGAEFRHFGQKHYYHKIYGTPFIAIYMRNWQTHHFQQDGTYMLGYEISKLQGVGRKMRFFVEFHHGYSEGQFFKQKSSYGGLGFSYGF